ncbi:MAG: replication-associated recombination protein A [Fibrobacterales bacterium]
MNDTPTTPLAERMRPTTLDELLGQSRIIGEGSMLKRALEGGSVPSMIFWGPPGCGKTSLAHVIRHQTDHAFIALSAVHSGKKEVREAIVEAEKRTAFNKQKTILFIDEIHRFNKAQQDSLLHASETGVVTLIGATTENPSFEVNNALLSRCQLILFAPLGEEELLNLIDQALNNDPRGLCSDKTIEKEAALSLISQADGDARYLLNQLEWIAEHSTSDSISSETLKEVQIENPLRYDKKDENHYNFISVFQKSIRGSDVDAALYWLHRMIQAGEDPRYLLRRLMRIAIEDIGNADPQAIQLATSCQQAYDFLGIPEGLMALDQLTIYLATAPKSNKVEMAEIKANALVKEYGNLPVPKAYRNAVNKTGRKLGYGDGYKYDHDFPHSYAGQNHLPQKLLGTTIYEPTPHGFEKTIAQRMEFWRKSRESK